MKNTKKSGRPVHIPSPWSDLSIKLGGSSVLAERLGVAKSTLNRWANGVHRVPTMVKKEVRRLCNYYKIPLPEDW